MYGRDLSVDYWRLSGRKFESLLQGLLRHQSSLLRAANHKEG